MNNVFSTTSSIQTTTKVILVRHARTTYNEQGRYQGCSDESILTQRGHEAAYQTGLALQKFTFDAIYSSPLIRVQQTTQAIIDALKQTTNNVPPVLIAPKLTEINMSDWQGLSYQEVKEKFPEAYLCWQSTPHLFTRNGTFFPVLELFQQARQFWQEVLNQHRGKTILIIAHGGTNRALISTAVALNPENYHSIQQSNCGISCLEFPLTSSNHGILTYLNTTDHLGENLPKLKAGKRGWRWLLLSNTVAENLLPSSCLPRLIRQNLIDLIVTDNFRQSKSLALNFLKISNKSIHLQIDQNHFVESWQQTFSPQQKPNYISEQANLVTGLIIVSENIICQILQKTLGLPILLDTTNYLSVIHYPQANQQSILQGILPINQQFSYSS